eukprot:12594635-Ditylum_brightwellii.AAC.1
MRNHYKELKILTYKAVRCVLPVEILRLNIASPTTTIQTDGARGLFIVSWPNTTSSLLMRNTTRETA